MIEEEDIKTTARGRHLSVSIHLVDKLLVSGDKTLIDLLVLNVQTKFLSESTNSTLHAESFNKLCDKLKISKATFYKLQKNPAFYKFFYFIQRKRGDVFLIARNISYDGPQYIFSLDEETLPPYSTVVITKDIIRSRKKFKRILFKAVLYKLAVRTLTRDNRKLEAAAPGYANKRARRQDTLSHKASNTDKTVPGLSEGNYLGLSYKRIANILDISPTTAKALVKEAVDANLITKERRDYDLGFIPGAGYMAPEEKWQMAKDKQASMPGTFVFPTRAGRLVARMSNIYEPAEAMPAFKWKHRTGNGFIPRNERYYGKNKPIGEDWGYCPDILRNGMPRQDLVGVPLLSHEPPAPQAKPVTPMPEIHATDTPATQHPIPVPQQVDPKKARRKAKQAAERVLKEKSKREGYFSDYNSLADRLTQMGEWRDLDQYGIEAVAGRALAELQFFIQNKSIPPSDFPYPETIHINMQGKEVKLIMKMASSLAYYKKQAKKESIAHMIYFKGEERARVEVLSGTLDDKRMLSCFKKEGMAKLAETPIMKGSEVKCGDFHFFKDIDIISAYIRIILLKDYKKDRGPFVWAAHPFYTTREKAKEEADKISAAAENKTKEKLKKMELFHAINGKFGDTPESTIGFNSIEEAESIMAASVPFFEEGYSVTFGATPLEDEDDYDEDYEIMDYGID